MICLGAQSVWQRVYDGGACLSPEGLAAQAWEGARMLEALKSPTFASALTLARENARCLEGMAVLSGGKAIPGGGQLCACFREQLALYAQYAARTAEPGFGAVYALLAQRQQALLLTLLAALGDYGATGSGKR